MATALADSRSFYIDDYSDEVVPCDTTLDSWAAWLASPARLDDDGNPDWGRAGPPDDGTVFSASAIRWQDDIIARRRAPGVWTLSREPDAGAFVAVRFGEGMGWSADNIVCGAIDFETGRVTETTTQALLRLLREQDEICDDIEYVAVGDHEDGWRLTYRAGPAPRLEAERVQ